MGLYLKEKRLFIEKCAGNVNNNNVCDGGGSSGASGGRSAACSAAVAGSSTLCYAPVSICTCRQGGPRNPEPRSFSKFPLQCQLIRSISKRPRIWIANIPQLPSVSLLPLSSLCRMFSSPIWRCCLAAAVAARFGTF